jgi:hypothetical protein
MARTVVSSHSLLSVFASVGNWLGALISVTFLAGPIGIAIAAHGELGDPVSLGDLAPKTLDPACRDRFLRDAPRSWNELKGKLKDFEVRLTNSEKWEAQNGDGETQNEWLYCVSEDARRALVTREDGTDITVSNERYTFAVTRSSLKLAYSLTGLEVWNPDKKQPLIGPLIENYSFLESMWSVWWVPLDFILGNDGFKLTAAECTSNQLGEEVVRIAFRYEGEPIGKPCCEPGAVYWAELLPTKDWAVTSSGVVDLPDGTGTRLNLRVASTLQDWFGGGPFPATVTLEYEDSEKHQLVEVRETRFEHPKACSLDSGEYFLTSYGISEDSVPSLTGSTPYRVRVILIATFGVLIAVFLLRAASRRRRTDSS